MSTRSGFHQTPPIRNGIIQGVPNMFLAIDIETGEYELAADEMKAGDKLRRRGVM
jgi:hypothetical protein